MASMASGSITLNTSIQTQQTVNLVTERQVKASPQLNVIAKQQQRFDSALNFISQGLADVPEVTQMMDEDTPDEGLSENEIQLGDHERGKEAIKVDLDVSQDITNVHENALRQEIEESYYKLSHRSPEK